jgi:CheY-like chemotaxis protein
MNDGPRDSLLEVLAVDDDVAQRHVLNVTLHGVARVQFCATPEQAVEAVRGTAFDVAILDVHLRRSREDGFDVARALHGIDANLEVLLYTGDDSAAVLESALEVRAVRRILKASPRAAIVQAVRECAEATRANREASRHATIGREARRHLEAQAHTLEISRTVADLHRGFFHSLANDLTALSVAGAVFNALAERAESGAMSASAARQLGENLRQTADANAAALARITAMVRQMTTEAGDLLNESPRAQVGVALQALAKIFLADARLSGGMKVVPPALELVLPVSSAALVNALRNGVHFLLEHRTAEASVAVTAALVERAEAERLLAVKDSVLVLNGEAMPAARYVHFHCRCEPARIEGAEVAAALSVPPEAGLLYALAHLSAQGGAPVVCRQGVRGASIELLFPAWS